MSVTILEMKVLTAIRGRGGLDEVIEGEHFDENRRRGLDIEPGMLEEGLRRRVRSKVGWE